MKTGVFFAVMPAYVDGWSFRVLAGSVVAGGGTQASFLGCN